MRLFLLPISTRRSLIYSQRLNNQLSSELTYVDKVTTRAAATWVKWEKAEKGWKKSVTGYGNKLFQRIPYEEWGLKSIPPLSARRKDTELQGKEMVDLTFPPSLIKPDSVLGMLRTLSTERKALHQKWMWGSILGMPLTIPFGLIPVLPNLPFFYLVFRAWSHWRALSGSQHLEFLLKNRLVKPTSSSMLDATYGIGTTNASSARNATDSRDSASEPKSAQNQDTPEIEADERMLLQPNDGKRIAETLEVPEIEVEIERAIRQVQQSLKARKELKEEKQDLDSALNETKPRP